MLPQRWSGINRQRSHPHSDCSRWHCRGATESAVRAVRALKQPRSHQSQPSCESHRGLREPGRVAHFGNLGEALVGDALHPGGQLPQLFLERLAKASRVGEVWHPMGRDLCLVSGSETSVLKVRSSVQPFEEGIFPLKLETWRSADSVTGPVWMYRWLCGSRISVKLSCGSQGRLPWIANR